MPSRAERKAFVGVRLAIGNSPSHQTLATGKKFGTTQPWHGVLEGDPQIGVFCDRLSLSAGRYQPSRNSTKRSTL